MIVVLCSVAGCALVLLALRDIFHTLWHPRGFGTLSRLVFRVVWRTTSAVPWLRRSELQGPAGLLLVAATWTALVTLGFALVYLPHMPEGFFFGSSLHPVRSSDAVASVYVSLTYLATLGLGDIVPAHPALRIVVPLEALVGFVLLTAVISWVLQLYTALARRRTMARRLSAMAARDTAALVEQAETSVAVQLLEGVRDGLAAVEVDLMQHAESYYFREREADFSLAAVLPHAARLVEAGQRSGAREVRHAAVLLGDELQRLAALLGQHFVGGADAPVDDVLSAFAEDHGHPLDARRA